MKKPNKLNYIFLGLVLAGAATVAQAGNVGQGYFSGLIGNTEVDDEGFDGSDMSFRIGGGYQLNENIAIEGYYIDYGSADDSVDTGFGIYDVSADATSLQIQGVAMIPVNPTVDLYGKLGLALWDAELCIESIGCIDDDGSDIVFGFGGNIDINNKVTIRAEYELADFDGTDVNTLMAGVNIAF